MICLGISKEASEAVGHGVREKVVENRVWKVKESRRYVILGTIVRTLAFTPSDSLLSVFSIVLCSLGFYIVVILMLVTTWLGTKCLGHTSLGLISLALSSGIEYFCIEAGHQLTIYPF